MAVVPQRRTSKTRKRLRRTHFKLDLPGMMVCPNCGEMKRGHEVCGSCGYYDGKLVKEIKVKEQEEVETKAAEKPKAKPEKAKRAEKKAEKKVEAKTVKPVEKKTLKKSGKKESK